MDLKSDIAKIISGEVDDTADMLEFASHDASLFELKPQLVVTPKDSKDIQAIVKYVAENKKAHPELSLTARSAGTDMGGGAINESIILSMTQHFSKIHKITPTTAHAQPGVFYRDFE